jgi:hypothetical protein
MPFPRTTEELYLWHLLNSIKNKDLCGQGWKMARPLWGLLWVRYGISAEQWGDAPLIPTFCYQIEKAAAAAFDKAGLTAFEKLIRARFEAIASEEQSGYAYRLWSDVLRATYLAQRNIAAYVGLAGQTGLTPQDCLALGTLLATRKPNEALAWVERGIAIDRQCHVRSTAAYDLDRPQRELLTRLGRGDEALEADWADFREHPSKYRYDELMKFLPKAARRE